MKKSMIPSVIKLLLLVTYSNVVLANAEGDKLIEQCRQEAESNNAQDTMTYISECLDRLMQYDTSE